VSVVSTPYHNHYWAALLLQRGPSGNIERLSASLAAAKVDLNPHQVDAALFAIQSPLSRGVILADEVGLGKTIEASIVIAQRWAERKRRVILIVPATLRKQWQQELLEKFALPSCIVEGPSFRMFGVRNAFDCEGTIVICSYHVAAAKAFELKQVPWNLVIMDEAHRLRNVYKKSSRIAAAIRDATEGRQKLLLTATPLQNSLMELYGLASVADKHVFGDERSFREQFADAAHSDEAAARLKERIAPLCKRTLRKQVLEYVQFTERRCLTREFYPTNEENELYIEVSDYLRRPTLAALPQSQRQLITLVLRKLLASSTFAIAATLAGMADRLESELKRNQPTIFPVEDALPDDDFETRAELQEEWPAAEDSDSTDAPAETPAAEPTDAPHPMFDNAFVRSEIKDLRRFALLANKVAANAKGQELLSGLEAAFAKAAELGAQRKAVVFTESRRTQAYLLDLLNRHGYTDRIVLMNASNADPLSARVYREWLERHHGTDAISGSQTADRKAAIVEEFRDRATILIATESAAEGVNLQFCSLVVNYDLPWNPQRIEQRIGRCHRYGQKHDVVVVNFLNKSNAADQRVYAILKDKFKLFEGVFGSSDEVLGALESGVDLEKRIAAIYQNCRTAPEIEHAFNQLQLQLDETIQTRMEQTRQALLENFDQEVHERLRFQRDQTAASLSQRQRWLYQLTKSRLWLDAEFFDDEYRFTYDSGDPLTAHLKGNYDLDWRRAERTGAQFYRLGHPFADDVVKYAAFGRLDPGALEIQYRADTGRISALLPLRGKSGWLHLARLTVTALEPQDFILLIGITDEGEALDDDICAKLMALPAERRDCALAAPDALNERLTARKAATLAQVDSKNSALFEAEIDKLERWSDDLKLSLEREVKAIEKEIREIKRTSRLAAGLAERLAAERRKRDLEARKSQKLRELFEARADIDRQHDELVNRLEAELNGQQSMEDLWTVRWTLE
jgi:adenine-specific DNA-methyltransferase